jgi:hypothetical protein
LTRTVRLFLLLSVCALALSFGGSAFAAYNPSLLTAGTSHALGSGSPVVIGVGQDQNDDATGMITIYAPRGYGVTLGQAPGTKIGDLDAFFLVRTPATTRVPLEGTVTVRDPAPFVGNTCSPGVHEAVWVVDATVSGNQLQLPMYVDRITTGAEAAFASLRIRICLPSPYVAPPQGAPAGASLIVAAFSVQGVFRTPSTRGSYPWNALFIPYTVGSATLNPANGAQSTSYTRLPIQLALTAKKVKRGKKRFARVTGCVREGGQPLRGVRVNILAGRTAGRTARVARPRTNSRGCATVLVSIRYRVTFFRASTSIPDRDVTASPGCTPPLPTSTGGPPARCTSATIGLVIGTLFSPTTVRMRR